MSLICEQEVYTQLIRPEASLKKIIEYRRQLLDLLGVDDHRVRIAEDIFQKKITKGVGKIELIDTSKLDEYIQAGMPYKNRYQDLKNLLKKSFTGENINIIIDLFAATTLIGNKGLNIKLFVRAYNQYKYENRFNSFKHYNKKQLNRIRDGFPLTGRIEYVFANAIKGDENAVAVDWGITNAFGIPDYYEEDGEQKRGSPGHYKVDQIQYYIKSKARKMGFTPRQLTGVIRFGEKIVNGDKIKNHEKVLQFYKSLKRV